MVFLAPMVGTGIPGFRACRPGAAGTTLAMLSMAFLAVTAAAQRQQDTPSDLIPITVNELRRLFDALVIGKTATVEHILKWSKWRRKHQATARRCHYKRRSEPIELDLRL